MIGYLALCVTTATSHVSRLTSSRSIPLPSGRVGVGSSHHSPLTCFTQYVNPFIGTGAIDGGLSGNCYPGPTLPFGMVQPSPDTREAPSWDCGPGYDYNDYNIYGFSHTRLSGTGVSDLIDLLIMPTRDAAAGHIPTSRFSHEAEEARPGYYRVELSSTDITAELTATTRCAIHRYTFHSPQQPNDQTTTPTVFIDLDHSSQKGDWDRRVVQSQLRIVSPTVVEGYRLITGWAKLRKVYFHIEFSAPIASHVFQNEGRTEPNATVVNGRKLMAWLQFDDQTAKQPNDQLLIKVSLSPVSIENARANMQAEAPSWDFDGYVSQADRQWNDLLSTITVEGGTDDEKQIFYTALYHTLIQPNTMSDANGDYMAPDYTVRRLPAGQTCYSTFSIWDTYRAAHPLYNLICPNRNADFITSMLNHFDAYGYLPIWHLWGQDNYCMIGNHAVVILAEAIMKGVPGIDAQRCYEAIRQTLTTSHLNSPWEVWDKYGYMPEDLQSQSVSITLEDAYDDWCAAQVARKLGYTDDYEFFLHRSQNFRNVFNPETRFFQGRTSDGQWLSDFDPLQYGANGGNPFTEGNAWQWLWYVPHDIDALIEMLGGKKAFAQRLDEFFTTDARSGNLNSNASGFIGQYIHGNEPDHHVAYLYDYINQPQKTQQMVRRIMSEMYNTRHDGYAGNDDCGEMSAWYIFSALGFYPVSPASGEYALGVPLFDRATLHLPDGNTFEVVSHRKHQSSAPIRKKTLNGKPFTSNFLRHADIVSGGTLEVW